MKNTTLYCRDFETSRFKNIILYYKGMFQSPAPEPLRSTSVARILGGRGPDDDDDDDDDDVDDDEDDDDDDDGDDHDHGDDDDDDGHGDDDNDNGYAADNDDDDDDDVWQMVITMMTKMMIMEILKKT